MRINNYFLKMTPIEFLGRNNWRSPEQLPNVRCDVYVIPRNTLMARVAIVTNGLGQHRLALPAGIGFCDVVAWTYAHRDSAGAPWQPLSTLHKNVGGTHVEILHTSGAIYVHGITHTDPTQHGVTLLMCPALDPTATHWRLAKCA